jgi:cytoskeleton protein RodZ
MTNNHLEESKEDVTENETGMDTLGSLLKTAREQKGLSIQEVAVHLHLRPSIVKDLEADCFTNIASSTYVRGYVKNFARLVGADVMRIHQCLSRQVPLETEPAMQSFSRKTSRQAKDSRLMWVTYFIILVLVALLVLGLIQKSYLLSDIDISKPTVEEVAASSEMPLDQKLTFEGAKLESPDASSLESQVQSNDPDADQVTEQQAEVPDGLVSAPAPEVGGASRTQAGTTGAQSSALPTAAQTLMEDAVLQGRVSVTTAAVTSDHAGAATETDAQTEAVSPQVGELSSIGISLSGECWINVVDAEGKVLIDGVKGAGQELTASGKAPIKVILGAPKFASLKFNGETVSLADVPEGRVARLTLPMTR